MREAVCNPRSYTCALLLAGLLRLNEDRGKFGLFDETGDREDEVFGAHCVHAALQRLTRARPWETAMFGAASVNRLLITAQMYC